MKSKALLFWVLIAVCAWSCADGDDAARPPVRPDAASGGAAGSNGGNGGNSGNAAAGGRDAGSGGAGAMDGASGADGSNGAAGNDGGTIPTATVDISPKAVTLAPGATQAFTASVTGTADTSVTFSTSGGDITAAGL